MATLSGLEDCVGPRSANSCLMAVRSCMSAARPFAVKSCCTELKLRHCCRATVILRLGLRRYHRKFPHAPSAPSRAAARARRRRRRSARPPARARLPGRALAKADWWRASGGRTPRAFPRKCRDRVPCASCAGRADPTAWWSRLPGARRRRATGRRRSPLPRPGIAIDRGARHKRRASKARAQSVPLNRF